MKYLIILLLLPVVSCITCYRGINIQLPGAFFNQSMASIGCRNADYCMRSFGKINGQDGSFSSCVTRANFNTTCKSYPECIQVSSGSGNQASDYKVCCCKNDLCNNLDFAGETLTTQSPTTTITATSFANSHIQISYLSLLICTLIGLYRLG